MTAPKSLISSFARFIQSDIKGGAYAIAFRKETIALALEQCFKGNYSPITEAQTLTEGKAQKTRAYAAGFATLGKIGEQTKKIDYIGSLKAPENKQARDAIDSATLHAVNTFFGAFDAVMAEPKKAKTPKAVAAPAPVLVSATEAETNIALIAEMAIEQTNMVQAVIAMIRAGGVAPELLEELDQALLETSIPFVDGAESQLSMTH